MKARRYITQFYKILPTAAVDPKYIHRKSSKKPYDFKEKRLNLRVHDEHPLKSIFWTGNYGKVRLYAVRMIDTYVLSINGRSKLYPKAQDIYKALIGKGVIPDVRTLADQFVNYSMLDLETITVLSNYECDGLSMNSHADFSQLPSYDWIIDLKDADIQRCNTISSVSYIPCLHEDKVVVELFLETRTITDDQRKKLKAEGFKEFTSSFSLSCEAIQEILDDMQGYF